MPVILNRISFSGELGFEIYCHPQYLLRLAKVIEAAGADLGYRGYGSRALLSMRLEKGWGVWSLEYRLDFNAVESGMDAFINWNKDFIGKGATLKAQKVGPDQRLVTMIIDVDAIDVSNDDAILKDGQAVGYVSSGGYAHRLASQWQWAMSKPPMLARGQNYRWKFWERFLMPKFWAQRPMIRMVRLCAARFGLCLCQKRLLFCLMCHRQKYLHVMLVLHLCKRSFWI